MERSELLKIRLADISSQSRGHLIFITSLSESTGPFSSTQGGEGLKGEQLSYKRDNEINMTHGERAPIADII